jgi:hypothetical protein
MRHTNRGEARAVETPGASFDLVGSGIIDRALRRGRRISHSRFSACKKAKGGGAP